MISVKSQLLATIVLIAFIPVEAQRLELDLATAHELALKNNPDYRLSEESVRHSKAQITQARGGLFPAVDAFSQYQRAWELPTVVFDNPTGPGKIEFKMGTEHTLVYGVNFQQPLFAGGAIWSGYRMTKHGYNIAQSQHQAMRQNILLAVSSAYYGVLFSNSVVRVVEEALETAQENLEQVQTIREVGQASDFDVLRAEVAVANYRPLLVSARNNARLAKSQLRQIMGIEGDQEFIFTEELTYVNNIFSGQTVEGLVNVALKNRPEIDILKEQKQLAQRQLVLARSALLPNIMFGTSYQYQGLKDEFDFKQDDFFKSFNSTVSLNLPLFHGWQTRARIQTSKIGIRESEIQEKSLMDGLRLEVETAFFLIQEKEENVLTQIKIIDQAREALRLARLQYAEGGGTQLDVMNAETALNQSRMNYQQSLFEYNVAMAQLKKALNQL
jgi:outer membrane protein TolC